MSMLISILTFILVVTSFALILFVLMQPAKSDGGMGAVMGGGGMQSTFGADTGNVLSGATIKATIIFFLASFALYLAHIYQTKHHSASDSKLPQVMVAPAVAGTSATPAPVAPKKP